MRRRDLARVQDSAAMHEPARRRRPPLGPLAATGVAVVLAVVLTGGAACSKQEAAAPPTTAAAKPGVDDALRVAQAAQDPLLATAPKVFSFGPVEQHPYACAAPDGCTPKESLVSRAIGGATNRVDLAKYFVNNMSARNWQVEGVYCDPEREQYVVLGSKKSDLAKGYPGRFELLAFEDIQARITVPAFGTENAFNLVPADNRYPTGSCPAVLTTAYADARKADGKPVTSVSPGTTAGRTTNAAP